MTAVRSDSKLDRAEVEELLGFVSGGSPARPLRGELIAALCRLALAVMDAPEAIMDTRDALGICAPTEDDFPALYALQGKRVRLVRVGEE
jgi:hypothetical protein